MNLKGFVLLLGQDVLIELLYEFNVLQLALVSDVNKRLSFWTLIMVIGMEFPTGFKRRSITPLLKLIKIN